jgi:hypothetical protein
MDRQDAHLAPLPVEAAEAQTGGQELACRPGNCSLERRAKLHQVLDLKCLGVSESVSAVRYHPGIQQVPDLMKSIS